MSTFRIDEHTVIVLGAGGPRAWPFHAGVLDALADVGHRPDTAGLFVGTSAGSAVATAYRAGASTDALVEFIVTPPSAEERQQARVAATERTTNGAGEASTVLERLRAAAPRAPQLLLEARPGGRGFGVAAAGALPAGLAPGWFLERLPGIAAEAPLPEGLWLTTVRLSDGATVVLGRDPEPYLPAGPAVRASSTVPWMFQALVLDGVAYVDGAVGSPTHADLALHHRGPGGERTRRAVISSVMTRRGNRPSRIMARRRLDDEIRRLEAAGIDVIVAEADDETAAAMEAFPRVPDAAGRAAEIRDAAHRITTRALDAVS